MYLSVFQSELYPISLLINNPLRLGLDLYIYVATLCVIDTLENIVPGKFPTKDQTLKTITRNLIFLIYTVVPQNNTVEGRLSSLDKVCI